MSRNDLVLLVHGVWGWRSPAWRGRGLREEGREGPGSWLQLELNSAAVEYDCAPC